MPISSVIAIPFEVEKEEQQENMLQGAAQRNPNHPEHTLLSKEFVLRLKCIELISTGVITALFLYDVGKSQQRQGDLLVAGFLGALLMCPFLLIMIPRHQTMRNVFFLWWHVMENAVIADGIDAKDPKTQSAYLKFLFAIGAFLLGSVYACEVFVQVIDYFKRFFQ